MSDRSLLKEMNPGLISKEYVKPLHDKRFPISIPLIGPGKLATSKTKVDEAIRVNAIPERLDLVLLMQLMQSQNAFDLVLLMQFSPNFSQASRTSLKSPPISQGSLLVDLIELANRFPKGLVYSQNWY